MPTETSALEVVDGEVRELIRRRGLEPFTDPGRYGVQLVTSDAHRGLVEAIRATSPRAAHQRRIEAMANAEVSWSTPTLTQPASVPRS